MRLWKLYMIFNVLSYDNFIVVKSFICEKFFLEYYLNVLCRDFDVVIVGLGMGGGVFVDDLVDCMVEMKRILVFEVGLFIFLMYVYNCLCFDNVNFVWVFLSKMFL